MSKQEPIATFTSGRATTKISIPDIRPLVRALGGMPDETVIDGEVVALDPDGRPSFSALQNFGSAGATLVYYVFDLMVLRGRRTTRRLACSDHRLPTLASYFAHL